jgi:hypothetical protein
VKVVAAAAATAATAKTSTSTKFRWAAHLCLLSFVSFFFFYDVSKSTGSLSSGRPSHGCVYVFHTMESIKGIQQWRCTAHAKRVHSP